MRRESGSDIGQLLAAIFAEELLALGVDGQNGAGFDGVFLLQDRIAVIVEDRLAVGVQLLDPVLQVEADAAGHVDGGAEDRGDTVGAGDDRREVHERHVRAGLLAGPQGDVVDAGHTRRADAHRALFGDHDDALVRMLLLQRDDFLLGFRCDHALAVQLAVGAGVRLVAGRQQVGRNVALRGDVGHDLDLVLDIRKLGEEFSLGVALQHVLGDFIAGLEGVAQPEHVGVVQEHLGLQDFAGISGNCRIVAECQIEQDFDGRSALHVRQEFKGESRRNFLDAHFAQNDFLQKLRLHTRGIRRARQGVVDEELEGRFAVLVRGILDLSDDLAQKRAVIDGLGMQALSFAAFNLVQVVCVQAHDDPASWC